MSEPTTNMFTEPEMERTLNKEYILRDRDGLLISLTVARIEGPKSNQILGNTLLNKGYKNGVNFIEVATDDGRANATAPTFENVPIGTFSSAPTLTQINSALGLTEKQYCRVMGTGLFYCRDVDAAGLTATVSAASGSNAYVVNGTATATGTWELLGEFRAISHMAPSTLEAASRVASVAALPTTAELDTSSPPSSGAPTEFYAVVANDGVYRIARKVTSSGSWSSPVYASDWTGAEWRKLTHAAPFSDTPHVASRADLATFPLPPFSEDLYQTAFAIVDDEDSLYVATSVYAEWDPWACIEPARCSFRASGFFTVHSRPQGIYLKAPWVQGIACYRTLDEAAAELNNLDLALVDHTSDGLFFMVHDKGKSRLLNPYRLSHSSYWSRDAFQQTVQGPGHIRMRVVGGEPYLLVDLLPLWVGEVRGDVGTCMAVCDVGRDPMLTPGEVENGALYFGGVARTLAVEKELMAKPGRSDGDVVVPTVDSYMVPEPVNTSFTYNGTEQSLSWRFPCPAAVSIGGSVSATNAGTYTATFTTTDGKPWLDGTTGGKSVQWTIAKVSCAASLDKTTLTLAVGESATVTVTHDSDGEVGINCYADWYADGNYSTSATNGCADGSVSGNVLTITGRNVGRAAFFVRIKQGTNYMAQTLELAVTVTE